MDQQIKVFEEQIEHLILKPKLTRDEKDQMLGYVATGVLSVSRLQADMATRMYGNGVPGGMLAEIIDLKKAIQQVDEKVSAKKPDKFSMLLSWTADRVLPALVIAGIMGFINFIFWGAVLIYIYKDKLFS